MSVVLKRVYEPAEAEDGYRVLVERLWPRGRRREALALDEWAKALAPSTELRRWYGHLPERWPEFQRRYRAELADQGEAIAALAERARAGRLTLVYAARDTERNSAVVLREVLLEALGAGD